MDSDKHCHYKVLTTVSESVDLYMNTRVRQSGSVGRSNFVHNCDVRKPIIKLHFLPYIDYKPKLIS